ncbi:MAG TPA: nucleoside hydrolase [Opitutaceae bacterium]|nr:nucleoside hydrolase [Opitutaceae bacterium]
MRRSAALLTLALALLPLVRASATPPPAFATAQRIRVIVDNDFGGDPDGLFLLAHLLLSPSVDVRGIVASQHHVTGFYGHPGTPEHAHEQASALLRIVAPALAPRLVLGSTTGLADLKTPADSAGARLIVQEALRDDTTVPLYVLCGGGLTNIASAYLLDPRIAPRLRLVWIGGAEHPGLELQPPGAGNIEYNLSIDRVAAQVVFNVSAIPLWQVPRDAYRQALVSTAELTARIDARAPLGAFLLGRLDDLLQRAKGSLGEAYVLGDNPLVLLTALQSAWERDPSSSSYSERPAPLVNDAGVYEPNPAGRPIRVYTTLDTRLMFEDLYAKIRRFDHPQQPSP